MHTYTYTQYPTCDLSMTTHLDPMTCLTWNNGHLSTSFQALHQIININDTQTLIICIQVTKVQESTSYIDARFPSYEFIYNNTTDAITCLRRPYIQYAPIWRDLNTIKITTPMKLTPYLPILTINNKLLTPILLIHIYMPSYTKYIHLIPLINLTIELASTNNPTHTPLLNRRLQLVHTPRRQTMSTNYQVLTQEDKDWKNSHLTYN